MNDDGTLTPTGRKVDPDERCAHVYRDTPKARAKGKVGDKCKGYRVNGTRFCKFHGGNSSHVIKHAAREKFRAEIEADLPSFASMWPEDHHLLDPFSLLLWDIRRSGARIQWYDIALANLDQEELHWGKTKEEEITASEFAGRNKTYEARASVLIEEQNKERKHMLTLRNAWQNDRFEAARVAGMGAFGQAARHMLIRIAEEFEIDLQDPLVQARVQSALEGLPDPIPALKQAADDVAANAKHERNLPAMNEK